MLQEIVEIHRQGRLDEAEARYRELLTFNPDDPETLHLLAIVKRQQGQAAEAVNLVRRAIELLPDRANYYMTLAGIEFHAGQFELARADFETALRLNPNLTAAYSALGQIAMIQGDSSRAEEQFKLALKSGEERPDLMLGYGNFLLSRRDYEGAMRYLTRAVELTPDNAAAQASLGRLFMARGNHAFAEQALRNAVRLKDDYHAARLLLSEVLMNGKRWDEAREHLTKLMMSETERAAALAVMGDSFRGQGDLNRAILNYRNSLEVEPRQPRVVQALAWCLAQTRRLREAVGAYRSYLRDMPNDRDARRALASLNAEMGLLDDARDAFAALLVTDPDDVGARAGLAAVEELAGDYVAADRAADDALRAQPGMPGAALVKARGLLRTGRVEEAAQRVEALRDADLNPAQRRFTNQLRGAIADAQGHAGAAVDAWLSAQREGARAALPALPAVSDDLASAVAEARGKVAQSPAFAPAAILLGTPGSGVEQVAALLSALPDVALLADRFAGTRADGFEAGEPRYLELQDAEVAVLARRYERALARLNAPPDARRVDWLPLADARLLPPLWRALGRVPLIVVGRDARDALLSWIAHGGAAGWRATDVDAAAAFLAHAIAHLDAITLHAEGDVTLISGDEALRDPLAVATKLARVVGVPAPDAAAIRAVRLTGLGGLPALTEAGAHARYRDALAGPFARLTARVTH